MLGAAPGWRARSRLIARRIRALAPDVVGLQEVHAERVGARSQADEIAELVGAPGYHVDFAPGRIWPDGSCEGVALLCKTGISERAVESLTLDRADFFDRESQRVVLCASLDIDHDARHDVDVFVTHLSLSRRARVRTMKELMSFTSRERHRSKSRGAVLMGDFNALPGEECVDMLARHWTDAWRAAGRGAGATWPAPFPFRRIDYVLVQPPEAWTVVACEREPVSGSDHRGVVAQLRLVT